MHKFLIPGLFAIPAALLAVSLHAETAIYKWVDEQDVTHYSQNPPPEGEAELIQPAARPAESPEAARQRTLAQEAAVEQLQAAREDQPPETPQDAEPETPQDAETAAAMEKNCAAARHNLEALTTAVRRRVIGPDGVAYYMSDEERQERIDEAKAIVAEQCK